MQPREARARLFFNPAGRFGRPSVVSRGRIMGEPTGRLRGLSLASAAGALSATDLGLADRAMAAFLVERWDEWEYQLWAPASNSSLSAVRRVGREAWRGAHARLVRAWASARWPRGHEPEGR